MHRRQFLASGGLSLAGLGLGGLLPGPLQSLARAMPTGGGPRTLIVVFQRGAVDGLNMVVPHAEPAYYAARPTIAIPRPGADGGALDLDGAFGLHPAMAPLLPYWSEQRMAVVHAVGSPDPTRSHFDAQDYMETATPGRKSTRDGWLNRVLAAAGPEASPFAGVAVDAHMPRAMAGRAPAVALTDLARFGVEAGASTGAVESGFEQLWQQRAGALGAAGGKTLDAVGFLRRSGAARLPATAGAQYPAGSFGAAMRQLAQLVKAGVGLKVGFAEIGGWDTHVNQGGSQGQLALRLREFAQGIAGFLADVGPRDDVLLLTLSEFGRTLRQNGGRGTDHGHGNAMLAFGNGVRGGRVLGDWPGLAEAQLFEGRDLAVTTDFRDVLGEVVQRHLRIDDPAVFPGYPLQAARFRGVLD